MRSRSSTLILSILTLPAWTCDEIYSQAAKLLKQDKIEASLDNCREVIRIDPRCAKAQGAIWTQVTEAHQDNKQFWSFHLSPGVSRDT